MPELYSRNFYTVHAQWAQRSSQEVVPTIMEMTRARSVVDVGCGEGDWLSTYVQRGAAEVLGLDGEWVDLARLRIPQRSFRAVDLAQLPSPERRFDLAQCLEVAEHLPLRAAAALVAFLTQTADVVVFSAAVPHQGGTGHLNEQWPGYWRALFAAREFGVYDVFRPRFWSNQNVAWWYAQNTFLYVRHTHPLSGHLASTVGEGWVLPERVVHPHRIDPVYRSPQSVSSLVRAVPRALKAVCRGSIPPRLRAILM